MRRPFKIRMENSVMMKTLANIRRQESKKLGFINSQILGACKIERVPLEVD